MMEYLSKEGKNSHPLDLEGIFRVSGSTSLIEILRDDIDQGFLCLKNDFLKHFIYIGNDIDLEKINDPFTIAGLIKLFLRYKKINIILYFYK